MEVKDNYGVENLAPGHLSILEPPMSKLQDDVEIDDSFPIEHLYFIHKEGMIKTPWLVDFSNYLVAQVLFMDITSHHKKKFLLDVNSYFCENLHLF